MERYIQLGNKNRPLRYSRRALKMLFAAFGVKTFVELGDKVANAGLDEIDIITHAGLKEGAKQINEPFDHTVEEVGEWLDNEHAGLFNDILEIFMHDFSPGAEKGGAVEKKTLTKSKSPAKMK